MKKSLTKAEIVRKREDLRSLFTSARQLSCKGVRMHVHATGLPNPRVVISPSRGFGNAVARNYIRRIGKEIFRSIKSRIAPGYDVAFVMFPGEYTFQERQAQIDSLLVRAGIVIPEQN